MTIFHLIYENTIQQLIKCFKSSIFEFFFFHSYHCINCIEFDGFYKLTNSVKASSGGSVSGSNNDGDENASLTSNTQANDQDCDDASGNNSSQSASIDSPIMNLFSSLTSSFSFTITKYLRLSSFQEKMFLINYLLMLS